MNLTEVQEAYTLFLKGFLNHIASYDDYDTIEMQNLAKRFEQLGIEPVLLVISDDCLESRMQYRDHQMNITNPTISCKERAEQSKRLQDKLISAQKKLKIPSRIISTDSLQWEQYAKDIINDTNNPI